MSTSNNKVVHLKERLPAPSGLAAERMGDLLKRVRAITLSRLEVAVRNLFDNLDDVLFDLAEKASSNAVQVQFFDGMRELRKSRSQIEKRFQENLGRNFVEFSQGGAQGAARNEGVATPTSLSLIGELELEESLAISGMVAKAEGRLSRTLFLVNQRLAVISGGTEVDDLSSPVGPAAVGQAFRLAMVDLDVQLQVKLIIYKLFDRYAMTSLDKLYEDVNAELMRAGVLPQGAPSAQQSSSTHSRSAGADDMQGAVPAGYASGPSSRGSVEMSAVLYDSLRALLAQRHAPVSQQHAELPSQSYGDSVAVANSDELVRLLSSLQNQLSPAYEAPLRRSDGGIDAARLAHQVKQSLMDQFSHQGGARARSVSAADEDTIDLVGMLFEFILSDRNLPSQFQGILGRLQIPYLKVAVLDKHLFAHASHPARRLLDTLARAGLSWSEESDPDHRLLNKANTVVERILRDFVDDIDIFDSERTDFEHFIELHRKRADLAEQRAAETARGREKLNVARRLAADEILKRIDGRELPPVIHDVLSRPWANYLVMTLLRHGEDSSEWRNGLRFADELVWSSLPKNTPRDSDRLQRLLPQLEAALRHGLATIASHDDDVHRTLDELSTFYRAALAGVPVSLKSMREVVTAHAPIAQATDADGGSSAFAAVVHSPVEEVVLGVGAADPADALPAIAQDDPYLLAARSLKSGAWFEFTAENGDIERAKLSWISPFTSNFLFVNRRGLKVGERSIEALALQMRDGSAVQLEQAPLFDRALDAVVGRLRAADPAMDGVAILNA